MESTTLYQEVLGLRSPWRVADVHPDLGSKSVEVTVIDDGTQPHRCPQCGRACPGYDRQQRKWRHPT